MAKINEVSYGQAHPLLVEMTGIETVNHEAGAEFAHTLRGIKNRTARLQRRGLDDCQLPRHSHLPLPHPILHGQNRGHELAPPTSSPVMLAAQPVRQGCSGGTSG